MICLVLPHVLSNTAMCSLVPRLPRLQHPPLTVWRDPGDEARRSERVCECMHCVRTFLGVLAAVIATSDRGDLRTGGGIVELNAAGEITCI